jgi:hypothetical protein
LAIDGLLLRVPFRPSATPPAKPASAAPPARIGTFALSAAFATSPPDRLTFPAAVAAGRFTAFFALLAGALLLVLERPFDETLELDRDFVERLFAPRRFDCFDPEFLVLVCGILRSPSTDWPKFGKNRIPAYGLANQPIPGAAEIAG